MWGVETKLKIKSVRGTNDILPNKIPYWHLVENAAHQLMQTYGYQELRTPIFEETSLFVRSIGEATDIVEKEMYTFPDRKGRSITLRPEGTAPIVRAYLEHHLGHITSVTKFYYIGPFFRYERPQAGRNRQFYQIGVEAIGSDNPALDVEIIHLAYQFLQNLHLKDLKVQLNTVGCRNCQPNYRKALSRYLIKHLPGMCENCRSRSKRNVMRILDCKDSGCAVVIRDAPLISDCIDNKCREHINQVEEYLKMLSVDYVIVPKLVRGLDYYTRTTFEIVYNELGAQNALAAGGRYDDLIGELGGDGTPAVGFAAGIERIILAMKKQQVGLPCKTILDVFLVSMGDRGFKESVKVLSRLREKGVTADIDYERRSLKSQMKLAHKRSAAYAVIIGDSEIEKAVAVLKHMGDGKQEEIPLKELVSVVSQLTHPSDNSDK